MLNRIIRFSLTNRLVILILSAALLVGGVVALLRSEVDIFPDLNAPTVTVMTEAPGFATEEVEQLVTFPIETAVAGAQDVVTVRSTSTTGFSVVNIIFSDATDIIVARQRVAERLSQISGQLPPGVDNPVLGPQSSILGEVLIVGLTSDELSMTRLRTIADRNLRPALQSVAGVSSVAVLGGDELQYRILLSPGRMKNRGVTLDEVYAALEGVNSNLGGSISTAYGNEYVVRADIATDSTDELAATVIRSDSEGVVTLADIATVESGAALPRIGAASVRTQPAVILTVTKQPGVGTNNLTERLLATIDNVAKTLPPSLNISTDIFRQSTFIDTSIHNLSTSLFEGALMVIIVLFFFMMNVRATLVSIIALPMSIIITVLILAALGITINTMTLGGIAIAIGSLVDDAIVDVENVSKRLRENALLPPEERLSRIKVIYNASKEVRMPIFNSSLIIVAGFMPLFFLSGVEGRMLVPLGVAFIIALFASTVVALTLTPVICSYLIKGTKAKSDDAAAEPATARWLRNCYKRGLSSALGHKWLWLGGTLALFVIALVIMAGLGRGFLPSLNEGSFTINVSAPAGISLEESDRIGRKAEELILAVPEIKTVARKTGRAELDEHSLGTNVSEIEAPYTLGGRSRAEIAADLRKNLATIPGVNVELGQPISHRIDAMLSGSKAPVVFKIFGNDLDRLNSIARQVKGLMSQVEGLEDITIEQLVERPEVSVRPRRALMARHGVTPAQLSAVVETALAGRVVAQVYTEGRPSDLVVRFDPEGNEVITPEQLSKVIVATPGGYVTLGDIAEISYTSGPNTVNRENSNRRIIVSANIEGRDIGSATDEVVNLIDQNIELPEGYSIVSAGQAESAAAATRSLVLASLLAIAIIIMLLNMEFHSPRQSAIILINMPLAMIGGVFALALAGLPLNIPAIIGFIALLGIATRNGMLLMSRYNALEADGMPRSEVVVRGSVDRLLPIVMTALTSALALIPVALRGGSPGNEIQSPLAIVILGGLASSMLLNLFIVPILFSMSKRKQAKA